MVININLRKEISMIGQLEIVVVSEVRPTNPITYKVKDLNGEETIGAFYTQELQLTKF